MEMQIDVTFAKLESDDLTVLAIGLDEAKTLVDQPAQRSVSNRTVRVRRKQDC